MLDPSLHISTMEKKAQTRRSGKKENKEEQDRSINYCGLNLPLRFICSIFLQSARYIKKNKFMKMIIKNEQGTMLILNMTCKIKPKC